MFCTFSLTNSNDCECNTTHIIPRYMPYNYKCCNNRLYRIFYWNKFIKIFLESFGFKRRINFLFFHIHINSLWVGMAFLMLVIYLNFSTYPTNMENGTTSHNPIETASPPSVERNAVFYEPGQCSKFIIGKNGKQLECPVIICMLFYYSRGTPIDSGGGRR